MFFNDGFCIAKMLYQSERKHHIILYRWFVGEQICLNDLYITFVQAVFFKQFIYQFGVDKIIKQGSIHTLVFFQVDGIITRETTQLNSGFGILFGDELCQYVAKNVIFFNAENKAYS